MILITSINDVTMMPGWLSGLALKLCLIQALINIASRIGCHDVDLGLYWHITACMNRANCDLLLQDRAYMYTTEAWCRHARPHTFNLLRLCITMGTSGGMR